MARCELLLNRVSRNDSKRYGRLLAKVLPRPIEFSAECDRNTAFIQFPMKVNRTDEMPLAAAGE